MTPKFHKAVFLDRDGTIIEEVVYLARPDQVLFIPWAIDSLRRLKAAGYKLIVVTNQSGVARGLFTEKDVKRVNQHIQRQLEENNAGIDGWYYCPYHPEGTVAPYNVDSPMRKPGTGMVELAARDHSLDLSASWMVGDKASDILCGRKLGMKPILVLTGFGVAQRKILEEKYPSRKPLPVVESIREAAEWILRRHKKKSP